MKANTLIFILNAKFPLKKEKHSWADFSQQPLLWGVMSHDLPSPQGSHLQTLYILFNNIWIFYMMLVIFHCQVWKSCCESADLFSLIVKINENSSDSVHDETESGVRWCQKLRQITFFSVQQFYHLDINSLLILWRGKRKIWVLFFWFWALIRFSIDLL